MDWSKATTPQKTFCKNHQSSPALNFLKRNVNTPKTPILRKTSQALGLFPILRTPDGSRNQIPKIKNPFESSYPERYHLPTICSPSMFQKPLTPQHCSTQFEWTIDEVSSLGPANLEPHETQFIESPDPELEARAQAAISSFFKEQKIVPSPFVDNNIMSSTASEPMGADRQSIHFQAQRAILAHISGNTPVSKPGRRIRDNSSQTVLSFPPILPPDIEELLKPFFTYHENQQQELDYKENSVDYEARDALLRRKLFDINDQEVEDPVIYEYDHFSPPPKSPELDSKPFQDSLDKSSFGSLSPISKIDDTRSPIKESPQKSNSAINNDISTGKRKSSFLNSSFTDDRNTPRQVQHQSKMKTISGSYRNSPNDGFSSEGTPGTVVNGSLYRSTPGFLHSRRSSSPCFETNMSIDRSVNKKISQLVMNSAKRPRAEIIDLFKEDDETEDEELQLSQFSTSIESPTKTRNAEHTDTPRGSQQKRRVIAKNLSQSFTMHSEDEDFEKVDKENINNKVLNPSSTSTSTFYRTDSGFNELTQSSTASQEIVDYENHKLNTIPNLDQSMTLISKLV